MLIGSLIVAVGAYLGLRDRANPDVSHSAGSSGAPTTAPIDSARAAAPPTRTDGASTPPPAPSATPELLKASALSASKALEKHKKHLVEKCWNPSAKANPEPKSITYTFDFTFDADGKQIARGLSEPRGASRPGVGQCLQSELPSLTIDPPGVSVAFKVEMTLP